MGALPQLKPARSRPEKTTCEVIDSIYIGVKRLMGGLFHPYSAILSLAQARGGPGRNPLDIRLFRANSDASRKMIRLNLHELGFDLPTRLDRVRTTSMKAAAERRVDG